MDLLAFGAHPDDLEFGCGAVLAREAQAGQRVHLILGSRGEAGTHGTPAERTAEAAAAAAHLGASHEFIDLGGDAHFEFQLRHVLTISALLRRYRPAVVLAPTLVENQHPDHAILARLVRDAARLARYGGVEELRAQPPHAIRALLHYAITPDAEPPGVAPLLLDTSSPEVVAAWTAAMNAHATQLRTRRYVDLLLARAQSWGLRCGVDHATPLWPAEPVVLDGLAGLRTARKF